MLQQKRLKTLNLNETLHTNLLLSYFAAVKECNVGYFFLSFLIRFLMFLFFI